MKSNKKRRIVVTERDREILVSLFKNKVLDLAQVQEVFFKGSDKSTACKRIRKLVQLGLIDTKIYQKEGRSRAAYGISLKGVEFLKNDLPYEVTNRYYVSSSILHDLILFDITNVFSQFSVVSKIYTESELGSVSEFSDRQNYRPFVEMRSDRMVVLGEGVRSSYVALEYERTRKSGERVKKIFENYYSYSNIEVILYVCENTGLVNFLMQKDREIESKIKSKVYFCSLDKVLKGEAPLMFENHEGSKLKFT